MTNVILEGFPEHDGVEVEIEHHFDAVDLTVIHRNSDARDAFSVIRGMSRADARKIGRALLGLGPSDVGPDER